MNLSRALVLSFGIASGCLVAAQTPQAPADHTVLVTTHSAAISVPVRSWKSLRDARIVKQDKDFSCGAASLATLLNEFYGQSITEEVLLGAMDKGNLRASFDDMQRALPQFGFRAVGFAASFEQLTKLKMPVVVYLKHRKDDHFSVVRGIDDDTVWLADASLGNRTFSRAQFLEMWETRGAESQHAELRGKFLAVLPDRYGVVSADDFFDNSPRRQTGQAIEQLAARPFP